MLIVIALLMAAQTGEAYAAIQDFEGSLAKSKAVSDQTFACMDAETKSQVIAQIEKGSAGSIVDAAITKCSHLKADYAAAVMGPYISHDKAQELADNWLGRMRAAYLENVNKWMSGPVVAEARTAFIISQWRKCVTDKARDWSRLQDEAGTIGSASVTACSRFGPKVQEAFSTELRIKKLPSTSSSTLIEKANATMREVAVEVVISERAKRLPRK